MIKKLDLYIGRKFLSTYLFMIIVVMSISIVIDISERLRDFTNPETDLTVWKIATEYYPYFFIHYMNLFSSLIIFLAVLFFTSMMASRSEIIAILSNGVSFRRFTRPYLVVSTILLVFSLLSNHYWVPDANKRRIDFESKYIWPPGPMENTNLQVDDSTIVHYNRYSPLDHSVTRLWVENWKRDENGLYTMYKDMQVHLALGDSLSNNWTLNKVFVRYINDSSEVVKLIPKVDTTLHFNIKELGIENNKMVAMTTPELLNYLDKQRKKGANNVVSIELTLHERTAYPFAAYVLTLLGLSVASRKSREKVGKSIALGLVISFTYIFFMKMTAVAATNIGLSPALAVWVPNVFFALIATWVYFDRMKHEEPPSFDIKFWRR
ncbi:MAG: LptF/LptG family permease [Flavobacteriales bacterium]|nr:LptF/LptG family permease [Flavobacteriales bacterium]